MDVPTSMHVWAMLTGLKGLSKQKQKTKLKVERDILEETREMVDKEKEHGKPTSGHIPKSSLPQRLFTASSSSVLAKPHAGILACLGLVEALCR